MKSAIKKVINICILICCVLVLMTKTDIKAVESTAPIFQIDTYTIDEGALTPGGTVTLNISVTNKSTSMDAQDVVLTMRSDSGLVYPVYGDDNQVILGTIHAGETVNASLQMNVSKHFRDEVVAVICDFAYFANGEMANNQVVIAIPSTTGYSLNISSVKVAEKATLGAKSLINFKITNISSTEIKDAVLEVKGNVEEGTKSIRLGKISANKQYLKDYYVSFTAPGNQTIMLTLNYTDENGEYISIDQGSYSVSVEQASNMSNVITKGSSPITYLGYAVAGVAALAILIIVILYMRKHI